MENVVAQVLEKVEGSQTSVPANDKKASFLTPDSFRQWNQEGRGAVCFIDGGNAHIFESAWLSVHLVRIVAVTLNEKKYSIVKKEFFTFVSGDKEQYFIKTIPEQKMLPLSISAHDRELCAVGRVKIGIITPLIRRLSELGMALDIALTRGLSFEHLYVLLDGSLEKGHSVEAGLLSDLPHHVYGLSKTTALGTDAGLSLTQAANALIQGKSGICRLEEETGIVMSLLKLHKNSAHVFRLDSFCVPDDNLLSLLEQNSRDPCFIGYPYGLVKADSLARISNAERDILKTRFSVFAGKGWTALENELKSADAHQVLDSI